jgi:hypothetical protein
MSYLPTVSTLKPLIQVSVKNMIVLDKCKLSFEWNKRKKDDKADITLLKTPLIIKPNNSEEFSAPPIMIFLFQN